MTGEHSSKQYDQELEAIRSKVLLMGGMVETAFDEAMECFRVGDSARAERVIADDQAVNQLEVQLDDACSHLIVRRQPTANDLRTVMATIKVITDLERIGDEATKVARTAKSLHERGTTGFAHYDMIRTILRTMVTYMMEDPRTISSALDTLWVAKAIERIGDHAKNIAEYVIYVVEGKDIRHSKSPAPSDAP
jgi:phosphate transport system protein